MCKILIALSTFNRKNITTLCLENLKEKVKTEKASFGLMGGFVYEQGIFDSNEMATALSGPCGGFSFDFPFGDSGSNLGLNYAYRQSVLGGIHTVGGRINIGN